MQPLPPTTADERDETPSQRADRNFAEVVQELRVAQTGVQILFAFLLSLPFLSAFPADRPSSAGVLTAALLSAAGAAVCFIAPVAFHRLHFRQGRKEGVVWVAHWMALAGLLLLVTAMTLAVWLVIDTLWSARAAGIVAVLMAGGIVTTWVVIPRLVVGQAKPPAPEDLGHEG
jgi:hypothetical protein